MSAAATESASAAAASARHSIGSETGGESESGRQDDHCFP
jgi:hypothetical protein